MTNLVKRILVGLVGIPVAVGIVYLGGWFFAGAVILLTMQALREFYGLAASKHATPNVVLGILWSLILQVDVARAMVMNPGGAGTLGTVTAVSVLMVIGVLATLTVELFRAKENALLNTAITIFGVAYITLAMSCLLVLRNVTAPAFVGTWGDLGTSLVATVFVSVWSADSVAYFVGMAIGRHKLFPRVSPKKSWEGAIGGLVGATAAFAGMAAWLLPELDLGLAAICGALIGIVGPLGDLSESLLKRDAVVKDSGGLLPGHGGVFDRFDSMLFAAPTILFVVYSRSIISLFVP
jgi:phosphatidate cytidylyltransferase